MARRTERSALTRRARRVSVVSLICVTTTVALSACVAGGVEPDPDPTVDASATSAGSASATPAASAEPEPEPTLIADGTATDNLPLFTAITEDVWAGDDRASGRAYIDALAEAGFDKASMQVTQDVSTVGNQAESLQFSVLWDGECLVGQVGPATGDPVTVVVDPTMEDTCLIGKTRPIDW